MSAASGEDMSERRKVQLTYAPSSTIVLSYLALYRGWKETYHTRKVSRVSTNYKSIRENCQRSYRTGKGSTIS